MGDAVSHIDADSGGAPIVAQTISVLSQFAPMSKSLSKDKVLAQIKDQPLRTKNRGDVTQYLRRQKQMARGAAGTYRQMF